MVIYGFITFADFCCDMVQTEEAAALDAVDALDILFVDYRVFLEIERPKPEVCFAQT